MTKKDERKSYAQLNEEADAILEKKVSSKNTLGEALKMVFELVRALSSIRKLRSDVNLRYEALCNAACKYVRNHDFTENEVRAGIFETLVDLGETGRFVLVRSKDAPTLISGDNFTQPALAALPEEWTRERLELDLTAMKQLKLTEEALNAEGLTRKDKFAWREYVKTATINSDP